MEEEITFRELIEVLLKGKKTIAIFTAVAFVISVIISLIISPIYEARTTLLVNPIGSRQSKEITDRNDVLDTISQYPEMTLETYKQQFLNSEVLQATIKELELKNDDGEPMKIRSLRDKVTISVIEDTNLIRVSVSDTSPELAASIANTLDEKFIDFITAMTRRKGMQAVEAITKQLEAEKKALDEESKKKRDYLMSAKDIEVLNQEIVTLRDQLTTYKKLLIDADKQIQSDLISLETLEKSGVKSTNINIDEVKSKIQLVKGIQTTDNEIESNDSSSNIGSNHTLGPQIELNISNASNLEDTMLTAQRTQIETRLVQNVSEKEVLEQKVEEIQQRLSDLRATLATEEYKYNEVMRNYELAEQSFQAYQTKKNEAEQNAAADIGKASIIVSSPAVVPDIPSGPNKKLNVAIGIVLGLMAGMFVVFFRAYWTDTENK